MWYLTKYPTDYKKEKKRQFQSYTVVALPMFLYGNESGAVTE